MEGTAHLAKWFHNIGCHVQRRTSWPDRDDKRGSTESLQPAAVGVPRVHSGIVSVHVRAAIVDCGEEQCA